MRHVGAGPRVRHQLRGNGYTAIASAGTGQSGTVGTALATGFAVTVKDATGALASGVTVLWVANGDGAMSSATTTTNGSGVASSTLTLGPTAGTQGATATVIGVGNVDFTATATADVAALIEAVSTTDQTGSASTPVTTPPSVRVMDQFRNPKSGVTVTFAVTAGSGSRSPATVVSGSDGIATLTSWTLGAGVGLNTLTASASGLTGSPVTFNATVATATPTQISIDSGASQTGVVAGQAGAAVRALVRDGSNNPVQGVQVTATITAGSIVAVTDGITDAAGHASFTPTTDVLVGTATITLSFNSGATSTTTTIASTFGTATKVLITTQAASNGSSGTPLPGQPVVRITDANGNTVTSGASSSLTVTITIVSGNGVPTNNSVVASAGIATFTAFTVTDVDGGANTPRYTATGLAGTADGDGITLAPPIPDHPAFGSTITGAQAGAVIPSFTVEIRDASNGVVPGATNAVTITLTTPGGATLSGTTTQNAVGGIATFNDLRVDTTGSYTFTATSVGLATPTAVSNSFTISAASGDNANLPGGYTLRTQRKWDSLTMTGWSTISNLSNAAIVTQSDFSSGGDSSALQIRYTPALGSGGHTPLSTAYTFSTVTGVYFSHEFEIPVGWVNEDTNGTKLLFVGTDINAGRPLFIMAAGSLGSATGTITLQMRLQGCVPSLGGNSSSGDRTVPLQQVTRGTRYVLEGHLVMNTADVADGILKGWVNGVQRANVSNAAYRGTSALLTSSAKFNSLTISPVFGGTGSAPPQTQFLYFGYTSVATP